MTSDVTEYCGDVPMWGYGAVVSSYNCNKRGLCCKKYVDHAFNHAHFGTHDYNFLVKPVVRNDYDDISYAKGL